MSNKKIIIRNCPALYQINNMTNECLGTDYQCQDCTDCVMKQIVELCKKAPILDADWILNKLDIQECSDGE